MEFGILGPLEVVVDGEARALPAGAERALFELLLLSAGRVVSASSLVDALWGEDPPANAANALQGRMSRLRRALVAAGLPGNLVATRPPGYLLDIDPEHVDAHRFTRLVGEGRRLAREGQSMEPIHVYDRALSLWRGDAPAELGERDWGRGEAARLTDLRLAATEERIDLELAAGRHMDVVAELEALTAREPLRERLHGQLMLAMYRSGRQADALTVFQRMAQQLGAAGAPLASLGEGFLARDRGHYADAQRHFNVALQMLTTPETGDWAAAAMTGLGFVAELTSDLETAERHHRQAWNAATEAGRVGAGAAAVALEGLACVAAHRRDGQIAARLLGAAARWRDQRGRPASPMELVDIERAADRARRLLGDEGFESAREQQPEGLLAELRAD